MPIKVARAVDAIASSTVCGKNTVIAWVTGIPAPAAEVEYPQSPCKSPAR